MLGSGSVDVIISDMKLGAGSGLNVLKAARALSAPPEVILITAFGTPAAAVEAMRAGAYDYICKPFDNEELKLLVQKAMEKRGLREENRQLRRSLSGGRGGLWVGESPAMQQVWSLVEKVAPSRTTVLITGESGTGKELVARALHLRSTRAGAPFMPVNCAALNEGVLESELFGHVKGAFTGAQADRAGILVSAGEGTVFLDEIGEVPLSTQVKMLRVLQERRVKPVGSSSEVPFHARVVAATNKRLEAEVKAGRFREDLLYRLNVITVDLPPLRDRTGDIPLLARHFLAQMREELGRPNLDFSRRGHRRAGALPLPRQRAAAAEHRGARGDAVGWGCARPRDAAAGAARRARAGDASLGGGGAADGLLAGASPGRCGAALPAGRAAASGRREDARRGAAGAELPVLPLPLGQARPGGPRGWRRAWARRGGIAAGLASAYLKSRRENRITARTIITVA